MIECARIKVSRMLLKCIGVALLSSSLVLVVVQARPTFRQPQVIEDDPLMALPSDQHAPQEVQYVTYQQVVTPHYNQAADPKQEVVVEYQPQEQPQYVYRQEQPAALYQLIQVSAQQQQQQQQQQPQQSPNDVHVHVAGGPDCHQRHEYTSLLSLENPSGSQGAGEQPQYLPASDSKSERPTGEYPGEIIYVGQNGQSQQQLSGLENVASSLVRNSDVSATILTEIPIRDMPHEVLSKLKREYGVKVVATRDRPGANLVINCDDYPNQEGSICGRQAQQEQQQRQQQPHYAHIDHRQQPQQQPPQQQQQPQQQPPQQQQQPHFTYLTASEPTGHTIELPAGHQHQSTEFHIEHEVQPTSEPANVYVGAHEQGPSQGPSEHPGLAELAYPQPTSAETHEPRATGVTEDQQPSNESTNYGTRTNAAVGGGEQQTGGEVHETTQAVPVEANQQENSPVTSEQYQPGAGPEAVDQNAGFDEQPKSNDP